jgi:hypothetical protein
MPGTTDAKSPVEKGAENGSRIRTISHRAEARDSMGHPVESKTGAYRRRSTTLLQVIEKARC